MLFTHFLTTWPKGASQSIEAAFELFNLLSQQKNEVQDLYFEKD